MKRIGILTAGGDTPALNATIHGAVTRANQLKVEIIGLIKGFNCLFNPRMPHIHLNPLYQEIPELDGTRGGTLNGLQPLTERLPAVPAPKTIDNDLGLNYPSESDEWARVNDT
jgi:6-phosphofructokinase